MCGVPSIEQWAPYQEKTPPWRRYSARYEAARKERIIITGPCGEERVLTISQAHDLINALNTALENA
jgi:hypothetical protein